MQALLHAIQDDRREIYASEEHRSGRLVWSDDWKGYGFPCRIGLPAICWWATTRSISDQQQLAGMSQRVVHSRGWRVQTAYPVR